MVRVGILGATGYTALEALKLLLRHPQVEVTALTTRQDEGPHLSEVHRQLGGRLDLRLENLSTEEVASRVDCVFCCLPHAASAAVVAEYLAAGVRVVDFSADYRLNDVASYEQWYGGKHPDADRIGKVPYGLPELFFEQIQTADVVANPGCFPTTAILGLAPLVQNKLIETTGIVVDSKTGVSGAGRTAKPAFHFPECNESIMAYNVGAHRHMPEIDHILKRATGRDVEVIFTPHLVSMDRGILSSIYTVPQVEKAQAEWLDLYRQFYVDHPFVRIVEHLPATKDTLGTNFCDITIRLVRGRLLIFSAIDNLIKGASGAAVQNFNLMFGFDQTTALL